MLENFLWNNKPARIKNNVMCNNYDMGGLRMLNLDKFIQSQNITWIKRLLDNQSTLPFSYISSFIEMSFDHFLKCNLNPNCLPRNLPQFYKSILLSWFALKQEPLTVADVPREVIWNNKFITINNKSLFNKDLYNEGFIFINDIIQNNGKFK